MSTITLLIIMSEEPSNKPKLPAFYQETFNGTKQDGRRKANKQTKAKSERPSSPSIKRKSIRKARFIRKRMATSADSWGALHTLTATTNFHPAKASSAHRHSRSAEHRTTRLRLVVRLPSRVGQLFTSAADPKQKPLQTNHEI